MRSIWAPRKAWCDSKDFYDSDEVELKRFQKDWVMVRDMGLAKLVAKADDDGDLDLNGDGESDELEEVYAVLWDWHDLIFLVFSFYATTGGEVNWLMLNQWTEFVMDCKIIQKKSQYCKKPDFDLLFITVDAACTKYWERLIDKAKREKAGAVSGRSEQKKALSRVEFCFALVHIAVNRYVKTGELSDVSEALHKLLTHVESRLDSALLVDPNVFRREYCYTTDVNAILIKYDNSLGALYAALAGGVNALTGGFNATLLSLYEWITFMRALEMIQADVTERDALLCFTFSRMAVIDGSSMKGNGRETQLPFEGFLEAIVRLSALKALPTDEEVESAGVKDAFEYLAQLRAKDVEEYNDMLMKRSSPMGAEPPQPIHRCVEHTIRIIIRTIEANTAGDDNLRLTTTEIALWMKKNDLGVTK